MSEESGETQALRMRCRDMAHEVNRVEEWIALAFRDLSDLDPAVDSPEDIERFRKRQQQAIEGALSRLGGISSSLVSASEGSLAEGTEE